MLMHKLCHSLNLPLSFSLQRQNYIDVATGSLGQGLSIAAGMAYCGKYYDKARYIKKYRTMWRNCLEIARKKEREREIFLYCLSYISSN